MRKLKFVKIFKFLKKHSKMVESGQNVKSSLYENHLFHSLVILWGLEHGGVLDFGLDGGVPPRPRDPNPCLE